MKILRPRKLNQKQAARWKRVRERGLLCHILITGVLFWGGSMVIAMSLFGYFMNPSGFRTGKVLEINGVVYPISGILFGIVTWWIVERNYFAFLATKKETEQGGDGDAEEAV